MLNNAVIGSRPCEGVLVFFSLGWDSAVRAKGRGSDASEERGFAGVGEALYVARRFVEARQAEDGVLS